MDQVWTGMTGILIGAAVGALLSLALPWLIDWFHWRKRLDVFGDWKAAWQPVYGDSNNWHSEVLRVKRGLGNIVIGSKEHGRRYDWFCRARLLNKMFLVGPWQSAKPGSHSAGILVLSIASSGLYMHGHFYGPHSTGNKKLVSHIALGREEKDLEQAIEELRKGRRPMPPSLVAV